jgi:hypothetical protein
MSTIIFNNLSRIANNFVCTAHVNDEIIYVDEEIYHDGCDKDGPKSNLHDLHLIINDDENMQEIHYYYHCENWYSGTPEDYTFYLEDIEYISKKTDDHIKTESCKNDSI